MTHGCYNNEEGSELREDISLTLSITGATGVVGKRVPMVLTLLLLSPGPQGLVLRFLEE